ncbi:hypothetical protein SUGI_0131980 [Cryptomeria japonica]|nr:hypothetical protein SUGI_0131980 [Cryptomeria japonica]
MYDKILCVTEDTMVQFIVYVSFLEINHMPVVLKVEQLECNTNHGASESRDVSGSSSRVKVGDDMVQKIEGFQLTSEGDANEKIEKGPFFKFLGIFLMKIRQRQRNLTRLAKLKDNLKNLSKELLC